MDDPPVFARLISRTITVPTNRMLKPRIQKPGKRKTEMPTPSVRHLQAGRNLARLRASANLKAEERAKEAGMQTLRLREIETGLRVPTDSETEEIEQAIASLTPES